MTDDRILALEAIAFGEDPRISPGDRMKALELLNEVAPEAALSPAMLAVVRQVQELSGPELDAELAGFFQPGHPPEPGGDGEPMPVRIEKEVERRAQRQFRSLVRRWSQKLQTPSPERVAAEAERNSSQEPQATSNVVPLSDAERRRQIREHRQAVRRYEEAQRRGLIPSPAPPGVDPQAWALYAHEYDGFDV